MRTLIEVDVPPSAMPTSVVCCIPRISPGESQAIAALVCGMFRQELKFKAQEAGNERLRGQATAIVLMPPIRSRPVRRRPFEEQTR